MIGFETEQRPAPRDVQAVSVSLADAALTDNVSQLRRIAAELRSHVQRIESELADHRRAARALRAIVAESTAEDVARTIDELLRHERELRLSAEQTSRICRKLEAKARHLRPPVYSLVRNITQTAERWYRPYLRSLRDLRWELMALEAENSPAADGPVLTNASDIDAYFRSLPPAA